MYVKHLRPINFNIECYLWPLMKLLKEIYWTFGPACEIAMEGTYTS